MFSARAATFTVTSNADSGPGTLREALTLAAANGSATQDIIVFNLPDLSEAGRTITITSQLPDISSNLIIDGSTQAGLPYGVSTTKVALFFQIPDSQKLSGLRAIEQHDIEIYGLYVKTSPLISDPGNSMFYYWKGIELKNDINIKIGAAGKGNVFFGFSQSISVNQPDNTPEYFDNLYIRGNFFGIDADGQTLSVNSTEYVEIYFVTEQVIIGGTEAEGNLFAQGLMIYQQNNNNYTEPESHYLSAEATILIKNNKIGVDYPVQNTIPKSYGLQLLTVQPGGKNTTNIEDNVIASDIRNAIYIGNSGRKVTIIRNYIGTDKLRQKTFFIVGTGIFTYWATEVAIGTDNVADANYITNCNPVLIWPYSNVRVNKNSFYCTKNAEPMHYVGYGENDPPVIAIKTFTASSVAGTATPNSKIELFYSDNCGTCSPQTFFGTATADAEGKWAYNGPITGTVIASATLGLNTSDFTQVGIDATNVTILNACEDKGSIKGLVVSNAKNVKWLNEQGETIQTTVDLINVPPGKYKLVVENGDCQSSTGYYEIITKFSVDITALNIKPTSCSNSDGVITGINITNNEFNTPKISWKNQSGQEKGTNLALTAVPAGQYILTITSADGTCTKTFGPYTINNTDGPIINADTKTVQDAHCDDFDGSITNITVTGTGTYLWINEQGTEVGHNLILTGVPAGKYKLTVTGANCPPVSTELIEVKSINGVALDFSGINVTSATCVGNNGSITGLQTSNVNNIEWRQKADNTFVANTINITGQPAGDYVLTISNATCSKSFDFNIAQIPPVVFPDFPASYTKSCDAFGTGTITLNTGTGPQPVDFHWVNSNGDRVGYTNKVEFLPTGSYKLYLKDQNGCENFYKDYIVEAYPAFSFTYGNTTNAQCGVSTGSVSPTIATGGTGNYVYQWLDASGNPIPGKNQSSIDNLAPGKYSLKITDGGCGFAQPEFIIADISIDPPAPSVNKIDRCDNGAAVIAVNDAYPTAKYRLYETATSAQPIDEQEGGKFNISVTGTRSYYVSLTYGTCESTRTEVKILLGSITGGIANSFTPNNDGINDYWKIKGIENYTNGTVSVFTRDGRKVFESKGYATPFDGTFNGRPLPSGVYYYVIDLKSCSLISGHLTILR